MAGPSPASPKQAMSSVAIANRKEAVPEARPTLESWDQTAPGTIIQAQKSGRMIHCPHGTAARIPLELSSFIRLDKNPKDKDVNAR